MSITLNQNFLEEILNITKNGHYITQYREPINLEKQIEEIRQTTKTFTTHPGIITFVDKTFQIEPLPFVTIEEGTVNQVIDFYLRESPITPNNVTVMNFASGEKTDQDWLSDLTEEEEALTRSSLVYAAIYDKIDNRNYEYGDLNGFYSYNVPIIRDRYGNLSEPIYTDIITIQEVSKLVTTAYKALTRPRKSELRRRVQTAIGEYVQNVQEKDIRDSVLIIGLYSCGPIGTHPIVIAYLFKDMLEHYSSIFTERNIRVDFALKDSNVIDTFRKKFRKTK